ncbi:MAG: ORF6N domain-containing protein [Kiritimatiellae bacterium]|nr:ORF6N domain-containing protein [Kiritimatiellia bacterium]
MGDKEIPVISPEQPPIAVSDATDSYIKSRIFTIRGVQVMLDRDLAALYGVQTKVLNQAVKRNLARFPKEFSFLLGKDEQEELVTNCDRFASAKHSTVPMRAFSEHGVIMVASILKSDIAAIVSVRITRAFVAMRKALASVAPLLLRIETMERRQITDQARNEERFDIIFKAMDGGDFPPQKVFFNGKHYDAYSFARKLVRKATKSIVLVDNYCDDITLDILSQKRGGADVTVATTQKCISDFLTPTAVEKFNKQNPTLTVKAVGIFHDRFLILDGTELYHFGASLKDLGRHYCAVTKMDAMFIPSILERI